ncbi:MAG: eL32 family ribosomal protein [Candidatus Woesearchaeota archaeon]
MKELLNVKDALKKKRPVFRRLQSTHIKRISRSGYRKPKGVHNKQGNQVRGRLGIIKTGYGYPKAVRGLQADGKKQIVIFTKDQITQLEKNQIGVFGSTLGSKKRLEFLEFAKEKSLPLAYDIDAQIASIKEQLSARKKKQKKREQKREARKKESQKKTDSKKTEQKTTKTEKSEQKSEKEPSDKETLKKEQDKVLITKSQ